MSNVLKADILEDPLEWGIASMTDAEVAARYAVADRTRIEPVPMNLVVRWAARHDAIYALEQAASSGGKDVRKLAKGALVMITSPHITAFDVSDPELVGMLDVLVQAGTFTQAERDDLVAMGTKSISRAEELGLPRVKVGHVEEVRRVRDVE